MKRLYYIRHGLSEMNVASIFAGPTDTPLTTEGRQAALEEGKKHKGIEIDFIITSPLSRAHDTGLLFAEGAGLPASLIEQNGLLVERNFGVLEGTPWSKEASHSLLSDNLPEGVETWDDMVKRAQKLLDYVERLPVDNVLLVGHGSIGRALRSIVVPEADTHAHLPNSELVRWI